MKKVLVHGCFDVLHFGHLRHFEEAKKFGDYLIVSVTTDRYVNKGPGRPYFSISQRVAMLESLAIVDEVIISDHPTAVESIRESRPDFYVKGNDYKDFSKDVTGQIHNENDAVELCGGKLVFTDDITFSSSTIINKFLSPWTEEQKKTIDIVNGAGGMVAIEKAFEQIESMSVLVVGEPIIDVYRFVEPEGISSKSPTVSARYLYEERYSGGALAIKRSVDFFTKSARIHVPADRAIEKIRYISGSTRIFECTKTFEDYWAGIDEAQYLEEFSTLAQLSDVVIVADFGHGMFNEKYISVLKEIKSFIGLNVQTNSSNYGFNVFHKHKRFDFLSLDTKEARLAMHDRHSPPLDIAYEIAALAGKHLAITLGSNGAAIYDSSKNGMACVSSPAFSDGVIDAIGAGDHFFLIATLLLKTDCPREVVAFVGNVYAGLKCKIIGNKESVSKANLLKACVAILK